VIPTVGVTRYVTPLREGGSLPGLVEADDLGTYVCKFRGAGQGLRVLVAEVIVGELARRIGLRTPRLVALDLDPEIARYEADEEVQDLLNASPGLNLGVDFLPGAFGYDGDPPPSGDVAARILWLDAFTANVDRSHYEDVLAVRVRKLADKRTWTRRYDAINRFEAELADSGVTLLKCMLHISAEEQKERLLARLDDPTKHWKFNPGDIDDAALWDDYLDAYEDALNRCNTDAAPWHVIPADRKWHRNLMIARVVKEALERLKLRYPPGDPALANIRVT
jgi:hypothetical protein